MSEDIMILNEKELSSVCAGGSNLTAKQVSDICGMAEIAIFAFFAAVSPSYGYSDVGANFMSLIHEYAEYHFGVNGKKESDPKCQAIIITLEYNGISVGEINSILDTICAQRYY